MVCISMTFEIAPPPFQHHHVTPFPSSSDIAWILQILNKHASYSNFTSYVVLHSVVPYLISNDPYIFYTYNSLKKN